MLQWSIWPQAPADLRVSGYSSSIHWQVEVAFTFRTVEICQDNRPIAFHKLVSAPGYSTSPEHRPAHHRFFAGETSVHTRSLVKAILERAAYPDQSYRSCVGIINLSKKYPLERLDTACRMALSEETHSYRAVKNILEKGCDLIKAKDEEN